MGDAVTALYLGHLQDMVGVGCANIIASDPMGVNVNDPHGSS